jgi:heat shock protein HtpX
MTLAQVVPLLLYQLYRIASRNRRSGGNQNKGKSQLMVAALVAYVAYWISQWIVLLLSRVREYWADRFSVDVTRNPKALVSALSKVAYGLVASDQKSQVPDGNENRKSLSAVQSFGILNINQSKGVALYAVQGLGEKAQDIKDIMQQQ